MFNSYVKLPEGRILKGILEGVLLGFSELGLVMVFYFGIAFYITWISGWDFVRDS